MVLYLDLIIFKEFIMDFILIIVTKTVLKKSTKNTNIIIACIIGVIETIIDILMNINVVIRLVLKLITSILIVKFAFKSKTLKEILKELACFYIVSFIFAGIATSIMFSESLNNILKQGIIFGKYSDFLIIVSIIVGTILITITFKLITKNIRKDNMICNVEIGILKSIIKLKVLLDTGNLLKEPITGKPVVIIEKRKLNHILEDLKDSIKIYVIPYKTLGNEEKVLFGIKPEFIRLEEKNNYYSDDVIIGLYDGKISQNDSYFGLIGIDLFEKE